MTDPGKQSSSIERKIQSNWLSVQEAVHQATERAQRSWEEVKIIGVTKYVDAATAAPLANAGCLDLGENRPQSLWDKAESGLYSDSVSWHVIGHLQRNKVRRTLRYRPMIHSVDSDRVLQHIASESAALGERTRVLLEVNISGDTEKTGMSDDSVRRLLERVLSESEAEAFTGIRVVGLMAMAGWGTDLASAQRQFAKVRELRDHLSDQFGMELPELSMGMSGDFEAAIAEGSTMVRIGSRLFEGVMEPR